MAKGKMNKYSYLKILALTTAFYMALGSDVYGETVKTKKGRNVIKDQNTSEKKTIKVIGPVKGKEAEKIVKSSSTYNQAISTGAAKPEYQTGLGLENDMITADFVRKNSKNGQITLSLEQGNSSEENPVSYPAGGSFTFRGNTIEDKTKIGASLAYEFLRPNKKHKNALYHYGAAAYATSITTKKRKIEEILKNGSVVSSGTNYYPDRTFMEYDLKLRAGIEYLLSKHFSADASLNAGLNGLTFKLGARYVFGRQDTEENKNKDIKKAYGGKNKK